MTRPFPLLALTLVLSATAGGCALADMHPGESCARCHDGDGAPRFGTAGTVYDGPAGSEGDGLAGATVVVTDAAGRSVALTSNSVGNFFTDQALTPPLQVTLRAPGAASQTSIAPQGDCNSCHAGGSAPGRLHVP